MPFYHYLQNNSGGSFCGPAYLVIVEADSADQANGIAEDHGVYFDEWDPETGEYSTDCPCCGARWSEAQDEGEEVPSYYDAPLVHSDEDPGYWHTQDYLLVYKDGTIKTGYVGNE